MSYITVPETVSAEYYLDVDSLRENWKLISDKRKEMYQSAEKLVLPSVIVSEADFDFVESIIARPNFITNKKIAAEAVNLDTAEDTDVTGKIVVIEKADPGYDWIFTKGIVGLITKYGGVASHMSIRCAEFDIPAAIGCGDRIFEFCRKTKTLLLDCGQGVIKEFQG